MNKDTKLSSLQCIFCTDMLIIAFQDCFQWYSVTYERNQAVSICLVFMLSLAKQVPGASFLFSVHLGKKVKTLWKIQICIK